VENAKLILSKFVSQALNRHSYTIPAQNGAKVRMKNKNVPEKNAFVKNQLVHFGFFKKHLNMK